MRFPELYTNAVFLKGLLVTLYFVKFQKVIIDLTVNSIFLFSEVMLFEITGEFCGLIFWII